MISCGPDGDVYRWVLVHGAWYSGTAWQRLAARLRADGHEVHTPTLAGHGADRDVTATLDDAADSLERYIVDNDLSDFILVGWSWGGVMLQMVLPRVADRVRRAVWHNAFVLANGESLFDNLSPAAVEYFLSIMLPDRTLPMPFDRARNVYMPEVSGAEARRLYDAEMRPEPVAMFDTAPNLDAWDVYVTERTATVGPWWASYVHGTMDFAFPEPWGWWNRFAPRLGTPRTIDIPSVAHMAALTRPALTAERYLWAGRD